MHCAKEWKSRQGKLDMRQPPVVAAHIARDLKRRMVSIELKDGRLRAD
jgi:hypothetical protein